MADDAVYDAIKAHLQDASVVAILADPDTSVVPPFRFENDLFGVPEPPAPWISMALTGVIYGQVSIGAPTAAQNRWDEEGHLWLPVFVPVGTGSSRARNLCKQLADIFRGLTLLDGSLEFMDAFIGEGTAAAEEEGNWFQLPLAIEWRLIDA
ncbi:MAG TPA: hypothetical protein VHZ78_08570 [Rhizomicrobium sp.]|jgi:hypothetical protein|nr:hypothetical protein [Rhizomicrobium sp.]